MEDKRLIEVDFPIKKVSEESAREKSIRHGNVSTLHIWWARKPLGSSRATNFAALVSAPEDIEELTKRLELASKLAIWENSNNRSLIDKATELIKENFGGRKPKVLDCFCGGGSIPLEALRLGCDTYALELNPVAVLLTKAVLEFPEKYGRENFSDYGKKSGKNSYNIIAEIQKWGKWILEEAAKEIHRFYPENPPGSISVGYIWARTIKCSNPSCGVEIPLMYQLWLANTDRKKVAIQPFVERDSGYVKFRIVEEKSIKFDPSEGTTKLGTALCPACGASVDGDTIRRAARKGEMRERLIAVVTHESSRTGKKYRIAEKIDVAAIKESEKYLQEKIARWPWDFNPVPDEFIPTPDGKHENTGIGSFYVHLGVVIYGFLRWGDIFNNRQKLALITFMEKTKLAYQNMVKEGYDPEYAKAVTTYLALAVDRLAIYSTSLGYWHTTREIINPALQRQALNMVWTYVELNPFSEASGDWISAINWITQVIKHCSSIGRTASAVLQGTATRLPFDDKFFDAVITDPPYYDNVPYSDFSNFFYVFLKRTVGDLYPELFSTPLAPKSEELIQNTTLLRRSTHINPLEYEQMGIKDQDYFERELTRALIEMHRVLRDDGIAVIVFAHKSTEAWETVINSLLKSGLVLVASWPVHTEMQARMRARESATLASSIYMVCRKRLKQETAYFNDLRELINHRIKERLNRFWDEGIGGSDFFTSAIGPAVEVFGRYSRVEKLSGEEVSVKELLDYVRKVVSEFALERILKKPDLGGVDAETRFYLLWRWTFGNAKVHFDDAIKLSRPMGVELTQLWDRGEFVKKEKEFIKVLTPQERAKDPTFLRKTKFTSMIDVLHYVLVLWERGEREKIKEILNETGYAGNEMFWQTAQAISEVLPKGDKEKQLLQGFLYGKEVYVKEARGKTSLLDYMESG